MKQESSRIGLHPLGAANLRGSIPQMSSIEVAISCNDRHNIRFFEAKCTVARAERHRFGHRCRSIKSTSDPTHEPRQSSAPGGCESTDQRSSQMTSTPWLRSALISLFCTRRRRAIHTDSKVSIAWRKVWASQRLFTAIITIGWITQHNLGAWGGNLPISTEPKSRASMQRWLVERMSGCRRHCVRERSTGQPVRGLPQVFCHVLGR